MSELVRKTVMKMVFGRAGMTRRVRQLMVNFLIGDSYLVYGLSCS
jgi:hypothetical protein